MNFDKLVNSLFKDDPIRKQLKKINLYSDDLVQQTLSKGMSLFHQKQKMSKQEDFLKTLMKLLEEKNSYTKKMKILSLLIQISKQTKYDVADILISKKLKVFTKSAYGNSNGSNKHILPILDKNTLQEHIYNQLLIPMYNFLMKLSLNEQLYMTCLTGQIPHDDIFRRGTKIRFIWIFKIYNLIHIILPILDSFYKIIKAFPGFKFLIQVAEIFYLDVLAMNNFVVIALEEAAEDNYMLMPYFDMLQFYESLTEQLTAIKKINIIYQNLKKFTPELKKPKQLSLSQQDISQIEIQSLRVKLISNSLKNPKKDHTRLQTEYNVKTDKRKMNKKINSQNKRNNMYTEGNNIDSQADEAQDDFKQKYRNLDLNGKMNDLSLEQVSQDSRVSSQEQKVSQ